MHLVEQAGTFDNRALLRATFLNETGTLPDEMQTLFRNAGLSHLLAISGYHVMVLAGSIVFLTSLLPIPRRLRPIPPVLAAWLYLLFIGAIPSLLRAVIMSTIAFGTPLIARRTDPLNTLGLAGIVILAWSPFALLSAGFLLSFSATAGIMLTYGIIDKRDSQSNTTLQASWTRALGNAAVCSGAAFVATLPILLWLFGSVSWYGLAANIPAIPLMGCAMNLFLASGILHAIHPVLSTIPLWATERCLDGIVFIAALPGKRGALPVGQPSPWVIAAASLPLVLPLLVPPHIRKKVLFGSLAGSFSLIPLLAGCSSPPDHTLLRFAAKGARALAIQTERMPPIIILQGDRETIDRAREAMRPWVQMACRSHIGTLILFCGDDTPRAVAECKSLFRIDHIVVAGSARSALSDECVRALCPPDSSAISFIHGQSIRFARNGDTIDIERMGDSVAWRAQGIRSSLYEDTLTLNDSLIILPPSDSIAGIITIDRQRVSVTSLE